ncbi:hypothetical protein [Bacillus sp. AK031]
MKINRLAGACIVFLGLAGCCEDKAESPNHMSFLSREEALLDVLKDEERDMNVYGSYQLKNGSVLTVFKGLMNDQDIWMADIGKENERWKVDHLDLLRGSGEVNQGNGLIYTNDETGYEVGVLSGKNPVSSVKIIEAGNDTYWIKDLEVFSEQEE